MARSTDEARSHTEQYALNSEIESDERDERAPCDA